MSTRKPPSEKRIGARIRVRSERAAAASQLFEASGFTPIHIEHRDDGDVSFWFAKAADDMLYRIATCIPREFYAVQAIIVGSNEPSSTLGDGRSPPELPS